jgi:cyclic-di-GMP-binding protein
LPIKREIIYTNQAAMNPLKYRLPKQQQSDCNNLRPRPSALVAWITAQATAKRKATPDLVLQILQAYNRCAMPPVVRLKAMITLQPVIDNISKKLRDHYQNEALPLAEAPRKQANLAAQFLDETAFAYKQVITDSVMDTENDEMSINLFIAALRLTIDHLGKQLLGCYVQYAPPLPGLWGEIHRTYQLAERNGLHSRALAENTETHNPLATVQHGYLRLVLLALATPNHLMPGQATQVYDYLEKWTAGCRLLSKKLTEAKAGDIVVDLASEHPPTVATGHEVNVPEGGRESALGYARFHPVDGRFLDISKLQEKLDGISASLDEQQQLKRHEPPNIAERQQRDLLKRLRAAWQSRGERADPREQDMTTHIPLCLGLDVSHHFISNKKRFRPEEDETHYHCPPATDGKLSLAPTDNTLQLKTLGSTNKLGQDTTRVSRFSETVDVWDAVHEAKIHARSKRATARAHFRVEPWLCINQSAGGVALLRLTEAQSQLRVGIVVATQNPDDESWTVGALRWLHATANGDVNIGIMNLSEQGMPVAVRAIGGTGTGGEYFRSILLPATAQEDTLPGNKAATLLVPTGIYEIGTQLVLNRQTELEYVRLTQVVDATNSYSQFEFRHIEVPPAEQAKISAISQQH